jgi:16S rRNA (guanine1207-N2)-methyltransferase
MRSVRLNLAFDSGAISLPGQGHILVFRPHAGDDLGMFPKDRVTVVQGFRPEHDAFVSSGYSVVTAASGTAAAALVCLPRSKAETRALIAEAAARVVPGGPVIVDGQKTDGIDAMLRDIRARVQTSVPIAKAHGRVFSFAACPAFSDWTAVETVTEGGFVTHPGMFSADGPDRGSVLLAAALPAKLPGRIVDLGAGWGFLARAVLVRDGVRQIDLVEAEAAALACARRNVTDPRARFHWADATTFRPDGPVDAVVCNPPFHVGRAPDSGLGAAFIRAAAAMLHPGGVLWLVANRHLPYGPVLTEAFRDVEETGGDGAYRLIRAARPNRARH